jgi:hypothetical protein
MDRLGGHQSWLLAPSIDVVDHFGPFIFGTWRTQCCNLHWDWLRQGCLANRVGKSHKDNVQTWKGA